MAGKRTLVLATGLFPDSETIEVAIAGIEGEIERLRLNNLSTEQEYDRAVAAIIAADLVITI